MPIQDMDPGTSPEAPGSWYFYKQGSAATSGVRFDTEGNATFNGVVDIAGSSGGQPAPANQNVLAWSSDPTHNVNSTQLTGGTIYLTAVYPARSANVTSLYLHIASAATTPTAGQNFVGLYSSSGARLATKGLDAEVLTTGLISAAISSTAVTAGSMYWVAMVFNAATPPTIARGAGIPGIGPVANIGLAAASYRYATNATSQTSLPSSITPGSNSATTFAGPWVAIS